MPTRQQITRVASYGLVLQKGRMLLCRISSRIPVDAGCWTLPGGGVDFGEDPADAMVREVHEETGLVVRPDGLAGIDSFARLEDHDHEDEHLLFAEAGHLTLEPYVPTYGTEVALDLAMGGSPEAAADTCPSVLRFLVANLRGR